MLQRLTTEGDVEADGRAKRFVIIAMIAVLGAMFLAVLALGVLREQPNTNSYALLADGYLHGHFDAAQCFDTDCAKFNGKTYVIFPPLPGVIAMPFVAAFGTGFDHFMLLSLAAFAASLAVWWAMAKRIAANRDLALVLVTAVAFATPLFFVALRGDHVWFFAQSWGFLFCSLALYMALVRRNALLTGLFIGMAFLCRQMTILYLPFLYVLLLEDKTSLFRIDGAAVRRTVSLAALPIIALAIYFAYNYVRFGSPMETGYAYIFAQDIGVDAADSFIRARVQEIGIFSPQYLLFNIVYMFIAGPHIEFAGRYLTEMGSFDTNGAALFLVTPLLLIGFLARWNRQFWFGAATCAVILGLTLLYHSNGFSQYSAQRYALDWLPILLLFVGSALKPAWAGPAALSVTYSMVVTLGMVVAGGVLGS